MHKDSRICISKFSSPQEAYVSVEEPKKNTYFLSYEASTKVTYYVEVVIQTSRGTPQAWVLDGRRLAD
jgi:hypothetical protein